jgi:hypothetical protein
VSSTRTPAGLAFARQSNEFELKRLHVPRHSRPQFGIGETTVERAHVLGYMRRFRRCRNRARYERMGYDKFEEKLRPVGAVELPGVDRQRSTAHSRKEIAPVKRSVDDDGKLPFRRER